MASFWTVFATILVLSSLIFMVSSQGASDFTSIDCGGTAIKDPATGIEWLTDDGFLEPGELLKSKLVAVPATVTLDAEAMKTLANAERLNTAMVFRPQVDGIGPSKYCYVVPVQNSTNYLVRAMFPNSNLAAKDQNIDLSSYNKRFYFTVDSTFISTIELDPVATKTIELVVTPLDENMYICLVPLEDRSSMPAISTIELRPLPDALYLSGRELTSSGNTDSSSDNQPRGNTGLRTSYLITVSRVNFGGDTSVPPIRYPLDPHDRLWYPAGPNDTTKPTTYTNRSSADINFEHDIENWDYPVEVLQTAWEGRNSEVSISFKFNVSAARSVRPIPTFYLSLAFHDVDGGERGEDIHLDDGGSEALWAEDVELTRNSIWIWFSYKQTFSSDVPVFRFSPNSSIPAMVNAFEVLGEFEAETQRTLATDGTAIRNFTEQHVDKRADVFLDTAGDPCLPVPWNWIVCSIESPPRITQINITSVGANGTLPGEFGTLDRLTALDLSNNSFRGDLPQSLASIRTLRELNLANNELSGVLPVFEENASLLNLEILSLRNNSLSGNLSSLFLALGSNSSISSIDLSHNSFDGALPSEMGQLRKLQYVDFSWNQFTMHLSATDNVMGQLISSSSQLKTLNLHHNNISGVVPAEIWRNDFSLQNVDLSDNKFDTLDLTLWCSSVRSGGLNALKQQVNLTNNNIVSVTFPCKDDVDKLPKPLQMSTWFELSDGFILLGNNPYCTGVGSNDRSQALRYVCRSSQYENFWIVDGGNDRVAIIASVIGGAVVLLMACILLFVLRRMWKRMKELRQIQEALAKEDVRPPFFKYDELKAAAGEFSEKNKLGQGAFGAVYKATLPDQSAVAVKVLEPTDQNISDFLKEMVLITGIKHKHLVQLKGCCVRDKKRLLVYEYAENKSLADALWGPERSFELNWNQRFKICVGVAKGLCYLHEELQPKIIHRDIKAQNILLDKNWEAKIADFGLALPLDEQAGGSSSTQVATRIGGTLGYFSPEYATSGKVTEKLDVFSYGILVLEIISGRRCIDLSMTDAPNQIYLKDWAFQKYKEGEVLDIVEKRLLGTGSPEDMLSVIKTALSCLQHNYEKRPTMSQVVNMLLATSPDEVAVDIIGQLKEQERLYEGLFDASSRANDDQVRRLLQSTNLLQTYSSDSKSIIEISVTKPR
ncbi:hypothetical protein R1sor_002475 [Riccia sorocarpa]|uniref:non-specific serine/threonine protein kinase n=1 Tax=Riccia sorocarpa TaxID=122646 RepID=A0ABD3GYX0_9MARC